MVKLIAWLEGVRTRIGSQSVAAKLEAIRVAASYQFPTADIDRMLIEIEGRVSNPQTGESDLFAGSPEP